MNACRVPFAPTKGPALNKRHIGIVTKRGDVEELHLTEPGANGSEYNMVRNFSV